jgi:DNA-binding transcriptional LysR family regulator
MMGIITPMNFNSLDLNLLRVFEALNTYRNASAAAEALGVTQPAVSNALRRLRDELGDELFTRTPSGMAPTPYGEALGAEISALLAHLRESLAKPTQFVAGTANRAFTVAMSDIGEIVFLPRLLQALMAEAPHAKLVVERADRAPRDLKLEMENGRIDLAVGFLPDLKANFFQQRLFNQRYVVMLRKGHPVAKKLGKEGLTHALLAQCRHAIVAMEGTGHGVVQTVLEREGLTDHAVLRLPHFSAVPLVAASSDLAVTVPSKLADVFAGMLPVELYAHPLAIPPFQVNQYWHRRYHKDPANQWFRGLFARLFKE